jgi:hypothetical protein
MARWVSLGHKDSPRARNLSVFGISGLGKGVRGGLLWKSIWGSDFHLLFTCWILFMLPAVSQSGGGLCQGLGTRGSGGVWLGHHLPIRVCAGGLFEVWRWLGRLHLGEIEG